MLKNWCLQTVVLEKTLESPLDCKIKPVNPKGNQSWIFTGRTDAEAEAPMLWPPEAKSQLIRKDSDAGKEWRQEEKGMTEDEMVGWHHCLKGHESEQTLKDNEGHGSLVCCGLWGCGVRCDLAIEECWANPTIPHYGGKRRHSHHLDGCDWATEEQQHLSYMHIKYMHNIYMIGGTQKFGFSFLRS